MIVGIPTIMEAGLANPKMKADLSGQSHDGSRKL